MSNTQTTTFYDGYWTFRQSRGDHVAANRVKLRHEQAVHFLYRELQAGARVLDVGCGDGIIGQLLGSAECPCRECGGRGRRANATGPRFEVVGADVSPKALELAAPFYRETLRLDLDDPETLGGGGGGGRLVGAFDAVVCLEVLEHIMTPRENVARIFSLLRPGGVAVFSFPNLFSYKNRLCFLGGRWPSGYTTYDPREHLQVLELPAFRSWVSGAGFEFLSTAITPDLPKWKPLRSAMFRGRGLLNTISPSLFAMQINVFARKPAGAGIHSPSITRAAA